MAQLQSLKDAPGTLREYETIYILSPNTLNDKVGEVNDRVKTIIEERGGKVIKVDNWGKRRLAYEIRAERKGIYLYWQYLGNPDIVAEFERNMRMLDSVMRYMTVKVDEDIDPGARPSEADDEMFEAAANTAADEEDIMLGADAAGEESGEGESTEGESTEGESAEGESSDAEGEADTSAEQPTEEAASTDDDSEPKA
jgi:small subunit ribosomal protein S6